MKPLLPQDDSGRSRRAGEVAARRETYRYTYDYFPGVAMAAGVPAEEKPSLQWHGMIAERVVELLENSGKVEHALSGKDAETLRSKWAHVMSMPADDAMEAILHRVHDISPSRELSGLSTVVAEIHDRGIQKVFGDLVQKASLGHVQGRPRSPADFTLLFQSLPAPPLAGCYGTDAAFAQLRLAGPSPRIIRRLERLDDRLPITDAQFRLTMGEGDSLEAACKEGRLHLCDYAALDGAALGSHPRDKKYVTAPLALFAVPRGRASARRLVPVAIQCHQRPSADSPVFTPQDGWAWVMARGFVQVADGIIHQAVTHLAHTHLIMEAFKLATERQLASAHPIGILLRPHFEGTLNINDGAQAYLTAPGGGVDYLLAGTIDFSRAGAVNGVKEFDFTTAMLPADLEARGVADAESLPGYSYRDDALLLWKAIGDWAAEYVALYYPGDAAVGADSELQAWIAEIGAQDGGRIRGVPARLPDRASLVSVLRMVIFTASAQHAAVNSPQDQVMSFAPAFPLASYAPPPTSKDVTEADCLAQMPTLDAALLQLDLGHLLGSLRYTRLGYYHGRYLTAHFEDPAVDAPLLRFQAALRDIETEITSRNAIRPAYEFLLPSRIPQSINI